RLRNGQDAGRCRRYTSADRVRHVVSRARPARKNGAGREPLGRSGGASSRKPSRSAHVHADRARRSRGATGAEGGTRKNAQARNASPGAGMNALMRIAVWCLMLAQSTAGSQAPTAAGPAFDVASIKPNVSGDPRVSIQSSPGGRFTAINAPVRALIRHAYQLQDFELAGGPK